MISNRYGLIILIENVSFGRRSPHYRETQLIPDMEITQEKFSRISLGQGLRSETLL